jgi:hypothetical protein
VPVKAAALVPIRQVREEMGSFDGETLEDLHAPSLPAPGERENGGTSR